MPGRTHVYEEAANREGELACTKKKTKKKKTADVPATTVTKRMMGISHLAGVDRLESVIRGRKLGFRRLGRYQTAVGRYRPGIQVRNRDKRRRPSRHRNHSFGHEDPVGVKA